MTRFAVLVVSAAAGLLSPAAAMASLPPFGPQLRISETGADADATRGAAQPSVAHNSQAGEYLVVWQADRLTTDNKLEVFAQRLSAAGAELGDEFRVSTTGAVDDTRGALLPAVAYNAQAGEYLVTWSANEAGLANTDDREIYARRVSGLGTLEGAELRVSFSGGALGMTTRQALEPTVASNAQAGEYLVVWRSDRLEDDEYEIFAQRLSAAGAASGTNFRVSTTREGSDGFSRTARTPSAAYNSQAGEYLVAWEADGLATRYEEEIFAQRLSAAGGELGGDFRVSTTGPDGDIDRVALTPSVAYNAQAGEYLVAWQANGLPNGGESEIFAQRVGPTGAEVGGDFRVSTTGGDGDAARDAGSPSVASNSQAGEYLVSWSSDGLATNDDVEIFAQRLGPTGAEVGGDFRVSTTGADGSTTRTALQSAVAYDAQAGEHLVVWQADGLPLAISDNKSEIFGQRLRAASPPVVPPTTPIPIPPPPTSPLPPPVVSPVAVLGPAPSIRTETTRLTSGGDVLVRLRCPRSGLPCQGTLRLRTTGRVPRGIGSVGYRIRSGRLTTARIALSRRRRSRLPSRGRLRVRANATARAGSRTPTVSSRVITVLPAA